MALWRFEVELADGSRDSNVIAAGNKRAAMERAERYAASRDGHLVGDVRAVDAVKGSM